MKRLKLGGEAGTYVAFQVFFEVVLKCLGVQTLCCIST